MEVERRRTRHLNSFGHHQIDLSSHLDNYVQAKNYHQQPVRSPLNSQKLENGRFVFGSKERCPILFNLSQAVNLRIGPISSIIRSLVHRPVKSRESPFILRPGPEYSSVLPAATENANQKQKYHQSVSFCLLFCMSSFLCQLLPALSARLKQRINN